MDDLNYRKKYKSLKELFANYDGNYKPEEIDWGEDTGREKYDKETLS